MKYIKLFEDNARGIGFVNDPLPTNIVDDLHDILLDLEFIPKYNRVSIRYHIASKESALSIFDHYRSSILTNSFNDVVNRIVSYMDYNGYETSIKYANESSHYFDGEWNPTCDGILMLFRKINCTRQYKEEI